MQHFCKEVQRMVLTSFPEERCPYCKGRPPIVTTIRTGPLAGLSFSLDMEHAKTVR